MKKATVIIVLSIIFLHCQKPTKNKNATITKTKKINQQFINVSLRLGINNDSVSLIAHYSIKIQDRLRKNAIYYDLDSFTIIKCTNKILQKIFTNTDERDFMMPSFLYFDIEKNNTVIFQNIDYTYSRVSKNYENGGLIIIQDINFDGYEDLVLRNTLNSGVTNRYFDIWMYNPIKKTYYLWHFSKKIGLWGVNKKKKLLTFGYKAGAGYIRQQTLKMAGKDTAYKVVSVYNIGK